MNKGEFIGRLGGRLAVLTDDERRDILDEYEQHIDIKVMRGMSEEEAIADFGRIEELAADILSAYHVRADAAEAGHGAGREAAGAHGGIGSGLKGLCDRIRGLCGKAAGGICRGIKGAGRAFRSAASGVLSFLTRPFRKQAAPGRNMDAETVSGGGPQNRCMTTGIDRTEGAERTDTEKTKGRARHTFIGVAGRVWRACREAVRRVLTCCWNLFWLGAGALFAFCSCFVIYGMGMLLVLLLQGYPLAGVFVGWLGLTLCAVSATVWCFSMRITGGRDSGAERPDRDRKKDRNKDRNREEMAHA